MTGNGPVPKRVRKIQGRFDRALVNYLESAVIQITLSMKFSDITPFFFPQQLIVRLIFVSRYTMTKSTAVIFILFFALVLRLEKWVSICSVGNPHDQMTSYMEFVTIFSSAYGRIFKNISIHTKWTLFK